MKSSMLHAGLLWVVVARMTISKRTSSLLQKEGVLDYRVIYAMSFCDSSPERFRLELWEQNYPLIYKAMLFFNSSVWRQRLLLALLLQIDIKCQRSQENKRKSLLLCYYSCINCISGCIMGNLDENRLNCEA